MSISYTEKYPAFGKNIFRFTNENSVLHERDLGIAGKRVSVMTPENRAAYIGGIQNCPWCGSGFSLEIRIDGERIPGREWIWLPNGIIRRGRIGGWEAETLTVIPPEGDAAVMKIRFANRTGHDSAAPVQFIMRGSVRRETSWRFPIPDKGEPHFACVSAADSVLYAIGCSNDVGGCKYPADAAGIAVTTSLDGMKLFPQADIWECEKFIPDGGELEFYVSLHLNRHDTVTGYADDVRGHWEEYIGAAFDWLEEETERIYSKLPVFSSDNPSLDKLYHRSLVTYSLNRWENSELVTSPFYTTGSLNGGCMCSYLWDYGGGLMLHPLVDRETNADMIRRYLHADLCTSYAITPLDGSPTGPWYHINHEKIIQMIYYYVLHTGDTDFLREEVDGRTIADWARFHAYVRDDISKPVELIDYGKDGESHLELRRDYVYQGVMPDLNARRYMNYKLAYEITKMNGSPDDLLMERAEALKPLMKTMWNEDKGWYEYIWEGKRDIRWTVQMFKFLSSPVIDDTIREKLISHLNDKEFLSKFGLHSMSKLDPAYDQIDIDNGGGGICTLFTMQIACQLYELGYDELASDILSRVLWWGERLPYMGDSCAANMLEDREDTPLQADISSVSCAQMILFKLCGISVSPDGSIRIKPSKIRPAENIRVENFTLRGRTFTLSIAGDEFEVITADSAKHSAIGGEIVI